MEDINHYHFETIPSTNTWAKEHAEDFNRTGITLVTASEQTGGRGRFKRHWVSPKDLNIYATFCFFVESHRSDIGLIPQLLALAVAEVLERMGFIPKIKWPNDVLLNGKKVAGILCETVGVDHQRCVVIGIGLNVNMPKEELEKIDRPATSLSAETGKLFEIPTLLDSLKMTFVKMLDRYHKEGFTLFHQKLIQTSYYNTGDVVMFSESTSRIQAVYQGLNLDGSVLLKLNNGTVKNFYAGEFGF